MINTIKIGNKEYKISPTYGHLKKILNKYPDMQSITQWTTKKFNEFIFYSIWIMLKRKGIFKPFLFKYRLMQAITIPELTFLQQNLINIILGDEIEEPKKGSMGKSQKTKPTT